MALFTSQNVTLLATFNIGYFKRLQSTFDLSLCIHIRFRTIKSLLSLVSIEYTHNLMFPNLMFHVFPCSIAIHSKLAFCPQFISTFIFYIHDFTVTIFNTQL